MSNHQAKFIKVIDLPNGDRMMRDDAGRWNQVYKTGNPAMRLLNASQGAIIDATIEATLQFMRKVES